LKLESLTLDLLARALGQTGALVTGIQPDQADLPTPCTEFDVRALVNHIVYDLRIFRLLLSGAEREPAGRDLIGDDWPGAYRGAADELLSTWRTRGIEGTFKSQLGELPARWAIGQHLADIAVHGWDIARATSQHADLDPEVCEAALDWARDNLKPQYRGQAFGPEVPVNADAPVCDRLAAFFGRDPRAHTSS
jgi:uncharacterized protein (TIGR03086 family)